MTSAIATTSVYEPERAKYVRLWQDVPAYRTVSYGEQLVGPFLAMTGAKPGQSIVDVGCGTGRASLKFAELLMYVTALDATMDAFDDAVSDYIGVAPPGRLTCLEACVWQDWPTVSRVHRDFVYCCDVLEHIPEAFTMLVVARCLQAAPVAFFHINFDPDGFGQTIGTTLHLTVKPFAWWRDRLAELGRLTEARDLLGSGMFLLERAA
jgi:SAM-dependent methyltransferase